MPRYHGGRTHAADRRQTAQLMARGGGPKPGRRLMCHCKCDGGMLYGLPGEIADCDRGCGRRAILHRETDRGTVELSWVDPQP